MGSHTSEHFEFVHWFRQAAPYINAHRGRTFVILFGGEAVQDEAFPSFIHDVALLDSLGIRLVLVHGARPQIERRLKEHGAELRYVAGLRVTDTQALECVKEAAGVVRVEVEALLSMGLANSPMAGACIRVASGNFVTARPVGVRTGVDYEHTGEVRRIDTAAIRQRVDHGDIVLLPPLGYSPTGEVFNLHAEEVATSTAVALGADKLLCLVEGAGVFDASGQLVREMTVTQAEQRLSEHPMPAGIRRQMQSAVFACRHGVRRVHLIARGLDGALLTELFTRDGTGTLITSDAYEDTRRATIDDVGGILELIAPLESQGVLVKRSRERLETEIGRFSVMERDGMIVGCTALYAYPEEKLGELACLAVHPDYRQAGRGAALLSVTEAEARSAGLQRLFVLTTHTAHWFQERGFLPADIKELPVARQTLYNYQRNSKIFVKHLNR
jgi:amino-acid N-acetyltransferase